MKTIKLSEDQSKFARLLIAASTMTLERFILFQEKECQHIGATTEERVMRQLAAELEVQTEFEYSKYKQFLTDIWTAAMRTKVIIDIGAYEGDTGVTMGMGNY